MLRPTVIDFETEAIQPRPHYPPAPVGVSIKRPGDRKSRYYAWGHPCENNCTKAEAVRVLKGVWHDDLLFQNAKFDVDVADTHLGLRLPPWHKIHDTLYLLFLENPHADSLSLKPSAERILGIKPEERDVLKEWILANVPEARRKPSEWGAFICRAPGKLVGDYANGDVLRTELLFKKLYKDICITRSMLEAYDRERRLMPVLLKNEREGIHLDMPLIERERKIYLPALDKTDQWLRKRLKVRDLNLDSDVQVAKAFLDCKVVQPENITWTKKGNLSISKKVLKMQHFRDQQVAMAFTYRNVLSTCINNYMANLLEQGTATGGTFHANWNQVRQPKGEKDSAGARTGRMSVSLLMNVPKSWKKLHGEGFVHPKFLRVPELPLIRRYFLPDKGCTWIRRDYNQQELRILAHFEDGDMMANYNSNPRFDHHEQVLQLLLQAGHALPRDSVKILNFQDIYGGGDTALAEALRITVAQARRIKRAKRAMLPDFAQFEEDVKATGKAGMPIRTWGGRQYYVEPPCYVEKYKRVMSFEYKLVNYLIQGSAADCTKESVILYDEHPKREGRFLVTVHDENDVNAPHKIHKREALVLRDVMQSVKFDVPMLSDGEAGPNWATLTKLEER